jgi:hypothetical protein
MRKARNSLIYFEALERRLLLSADVLPLPVDVPADTAQEIPVVVVSVVAESGGNDADVQTLLLEETDGDDVSLNENVTAEVLPESEPLVVETEAFDDLAAGGEAVTPMQADDTEGTSATIHDSDAGTDSRLDTLIFVNDNIADSDQISDYFQTGENDSSQRIVILDSTTGGIDQITSVLEEYTDISSVHIFSHGADGAVQLGSTWLNDYNLASSQDALSGWSLSLTEQADILLYGCNLAESESGRAFVERLHVLTGADVAASEDPTGHETLGGDWLLEYQSGHIEATLPLSAEAQHDWINLLAEETVSDDFGTGDYTGSSGSLPWLGDWIEIGDEGTSGAGVVQVVSDELSIIAANDSEAMRGVSRGVDMTGATTAYLSFDYYSVVLNDGGNGSVEVQINPNGAGWTILATYFISGAGPSGTEFFEVTDYISANTEVRFVSAGLGSGDGLSLGNDEFYLDNVKFEYTTTSFETAFWFTTNGNPSGEGQLIIDTWQKGDLVTLANPNLALEDGVDSANVTSGGTLSMGAEISNFINNKNISAVHYVGSDLFLGASDFQLFAGDLILSSTDADTFGGLAVEKGDVVVFHPDTAGDYSSGTFAVLLKGLATNDIKGITLVEQNTTVGDTELKAGDFLFIEDEGSLDNVIQRFETIDVGPLSTSGIVTTLVDGNNLNVNIDSIEGIDLVEVTTTIGGRTLNSGEIVLSGKDDGTVGINNLFIEKQDIFVISVAPTTGDVTATLLFQGSDLGFDEDKERIDGFSLTSQSNSQPAATNINAAENFIEDTPLNLIDIVVSDTDGNEIAVTLTLSDPSAGSLSTATSGIVSSTFSGGIWTASGAITDVNTLLAGVVFTPALNYDSNFTIATRVDDGIAVPLTGVKNMTVTPINDAPTATNLNAAETYTEDTDLNLADISITDVDSATVTATLTLSEVAAGDLSTATSGGVTSIWDDGTGIWTASGDVADVNVLLAGVLFTPTAGYNASFDILTSVDDGEAAAITGTKMMTAIAVNNPPIATNLDAAESYTEDTPLDLINIVISDIDSTNVTATLILSDPDAGSLSTATSGAVTSTYNSVSGVWTASGLLVDVNALLAGVIFSPSLNYNSGFSIATSVDDGVAAAITGTKVVTATAVNDPPTATNLSTSEGYIEDADLNLTNIVISDVDSASVTATLTLSDTGAGSLSIGTSGTVTSSYDAGTGVWIATGALADVNALLEDVTFIPTLNYNDDFVINTSVEDGWSAVTGTKNIIGTAVNDAPTATNLDAAESYTEDISLDLVDIVISDIDSTEVTVMLTLSDFTAGSLTTGTSGTVTSTFADGVWTASGALADVNSLLAGVTFNPALNYDSDFSVITSVDDGTAASVMGDKIFIATPVNDAPTATNLNAAESYTEDVALNLIDIVISDVDSANVTATLTLSDISAGSLSTGTSGAVTSTFAGGVWTASGALADVNSVLAGVTFVPALNYDSGFSITTSVDDGVAAPVTGIKSFTATPVNDAPTATNLSAAESYTEDVALNLIDIVMSDPDSANVTATLTLSDAGAGSLSTGTSGAVTSTFTGGVWTASGALADVNSLLAGVTFVPALNYDSGFSITTSVDDGVAAPVTGIKSFTATPVNDAPTATNLSAAESYTEDVALNLIDIVMSDPDSANVTATLTLSDAGAGSLSTGTSGAVTSTFTGGVWTASGALADVNSLLAGVTFVPALNYDSGFSITTSVDDGVAAPVTGIKSFTATPVNDAPTATNLSAAESYTEDVALNLIDIVMSDPDSANVTATLTLSDAGAGSLSTGTSGAVTSTFAGGVWTASGALADVNTLLAGVTFTPAPNYDSGFFINSSVTDGVSPAIMGSKTLNATAVNDGPTATNLSGGAIYTEDTPLDLTDIVINDIDSVHVTAKLTLLEMSAGSLSTATSGAVTSTFAGGVWVASGALADVNTLLAGVHFTPAPNYNSAVYITTSIDDGEAPALTGGYDISGIAVGDTPQVTSSTTDPGVQSGLIFIQRNGADGPEVTHFKISAITNGSLFHADGITPVNDNDFLTVAQGSAGVRFTPASTVNGSFKVETSEDGATVAAQSGSAVSVISIHLPPPTTIPPDDIVTPPVDTPDVPDVDSEELEESEAIENVVDSVVGIPLDVSSPELVEPVSATAEAETSTEEDTEEEEEEEQERVSITATGGGGQAGGTALTGGAGAASAADLKFDLVLKQAESNSMTLQQVNQIESSIRAIENEVIRHDLKTEMNTVLDLLYKKRSILETQMLKESLDLLREETTSEARLEKTVIGSAIAATTSLSAGYVIWLIRSGVLLSSLLSSMPAWQLADPLAVLAGKRDESEDDADDSLAGIIKSGEQKTETELSEKNDQRL